MTYQFIDYDPVLHAALDAWRSDDIAEFAMNEGIGSEWRYYIDAPEYQAGVDAFCKVVLLDDMPVAAMIVLCHPEYPVGINPIIVDPARVGQGHCCAILREFAENIEAILPGKRERIRVYIDNENIASVRAFAKAGFACVGEHPDGDGAYYELEV